MAHFTLVPGRSRARLREGVTLPTERYGPAAPRRTQEEREHARENCTGLTVSKWWEYGTGMSLLCEQGKRMAAARTERIHIGNRVN